MSGNITEGLSGVRRSGNGWSAKCPAHEDRQNSLSVSVGDGGKHLYKCHAGCSYEDIMRALGLNGPRSNGNGSKPYPSSRDAALSAARHAGGELAGEWVYKRASGVTAFMVYRIDFPNGSKQFRPVRQTEHGWVLSQEAGSRPLYRLPELVAADPTKVVYVTEGEKAADAAAKLGLLVTTSAGGASAFTKSDWTVLAGRRVVVMPDNDEAGQVYAQRVTEILAKLSPPASTRVVNLPGLPYKGDIVEFVDARDGKTIEQITEEIEALTKDARESGAPRPLTQAEALALWDARANIRAATTGIPDLDEVLSGGLPTQQITVLVGPTNTGKSELARQIGRSAALTGIRVIRVDVELGVVRIIERDLSQESGIAARRLRDNLIDSHEHKKVVEARTKLMADTNVVTYSPKYGQPLNELLQVVERACERRQSLVVIDSLQRVAAGVDLSDQRLQVQHTMWQLERFAREHDVSLLVTSEQRRQGRDDGAALNSAAESRSIEYTADALLVMEPSKRDETTVSAAGGTFERRVGLSVLKNRLGDTGRLGIDLLFKGPCWGMDAVPREDNYLEEKIDEVLSDGAWHKTDSIRSKVKRRKQDVLEILRFRLKASTVEHDEKTGWRLVPGSGTNGNWGQKHTGTNAEPGVENNV